MSTTITIMRQDFRRLVRAVVVIESLAAQAMLGERAYVLREIHRIARDAQIPGPRDEAVPLGVAGYPIGTRRRGGAR